MSLSRFFIDRPVFAWVIAIVIMLAGGISVFSLPVAQYPTIAPPAVQVNANYPGADATTMQNSVTQVIEQQLTGLDHLLYFGSTSNADGTVAITATFAPGTDPDIAQVQVQNKVQQAVAQLPAQVQQLGVTVAKAQANFLLLVAMYDESDRTTGRDVADFIISKMQDTLLRVPGVGTAIVFGSPYAMRVWLDPYKLRNYGLQPSDIRAAIQAQNVQVSAGSIGAQPAVANQAMNATVTAQSQLQTAEEFREALQGLDLPKTSDSDSIPTATLDVPSHPAAYKTPSSRGSKSWDPVVLETARKNLAIFIGPMAKVIVGRAVTHARSVEDLYQALATEISSPNDREKFLRSKPL